MNGRSEFEYLPPETLDRLKNIELVAHGLVEGGLLGLHRSPYHGFSSEFSEYRKYVAGDGIRYIDWKAYARTDRYYIKRFEEETNLHSFIVLDQSASMGMPDPAAPAKFNYCCYLAAAFMYLMYQQHDGAGLFTFARTITQAVDCKCSRPHLIDLLRRLERLKPEGESGDGDCLVRIAERIPKRSLVMLFSDFLFDRHPEALKALDMLSFKGCELILFQAMNTAEQQFPFHGLVEFEDVETGRTLELECEACRDYYLDEWKKFNAKLKNYCDRRAIVLEPLTTATPFTRALAAYFSKRREMY